MWDGPFVGPAFGPGAVHGCLSWAADGHTLALISSGAPSPDRGVRLLDTAAPGSSLLASSRLVLATPAGPENSSGNYWRQVLISAGGQVIIVVIQVEAHHASGRMPGVTQKLVTFSATTGTLLRELNHLPVHGGYEHVPWASPSGQLLIVTGTSPAPPSAPSTSGTAPVPQPGPLHPDPLVHPYLRSRLVAPSPARSRTGPASIWHRPAILPRSGSPIESGHHATLGSLALASVRDPPFGATFGFMVLIS